MLNTLSAALIRGARKVLKKLGTVRKKGKAKVLKNFGGIRIKMKMVLSIALALIVSFIIVGTIILSESTSALNDVHYKKAVSQVDALVASLRVNLEKPLSTTSALAESFSFLTKAGDVSREKLQELIYSVFIGSEDIYKSIFTLWEPNAFDGWDSKNVNTRVSDETGRIMYWYYNNGNSCRIRIYDINKIFEYPSFYEETKAKLTNVCSEPYYTEIDGVQTRCIALSSPIILGGRFIGLVGYEVATESLQTTLEELDVDGMNGQWISAGETYVAASDSELLMQPATLSDEYREAMAAGIPYEVKNDGVYRVYVPYTLSETGSPWCISIGVPLTSKEASSIIFEGLLVFGISLIAIIVIIFIISGSIVKPIKKLVGSANSMANGDMNFTMDIKSRDETRQLADAFENVRNSIKKMVDDVNKTAKDIIAGNLINRADESKYAGDFGNIMAGLNKIMDSISELVKNIKDSALSVSAASQQISNGSQQLAQGAAEQAAAIEEINATVSEVVGQTKLAADSAATAKRINEKVHTDAENGSEKMQILLVALEEINTASANISKIIKTIEDIAFQTNILALNASVEAARAGIHGKGFAVVAAEVKNLATKSATAAKETNDLIHESIVKAKGGVTIGEDMRQTLTNMVRGVNLAVEAITKIAEESMRQVETIEELNSGLEQISQVVQNNTATAEESASSSEEMSAQAEMLNNMVSRYKVN